MTVIVSCAVQASNHMSGNGGDEFASGRGKGDQVTFILSRHVGLDAQAGCRGGGI